MPVVSSMYVQIKSVLSLERYVRAHFIRFLTLLPSQHTYSDQRAATGGAVPSDSEAATATVRSLSLCILCLCVCLFLPVCPTLFCACQPFHLFILVTHTCSVLNLQRLANRAARASDREAVRDRDD